MNKTIIININSIVFHIEEDAYEILRNYMIEIKKHFGYSEDSGEILQDIENRIAEMFSERIHSGKKEVISVSDVNDIIAVMGKVSDFEEAEIDEDISSGKETRNEGGQKYNFEKKLLRNPDDMIIGGVCSGLGYYFGMDTKWMRLLFVLFFIFGGSGVLLYVVLWIVMPMASTRADRMAMRGEEPNLQNFQKNIDEAWEGYKGNFSEAKKFVSKGAQSISGGASSAFRGIGTVLGFLVLFLLGLVIIGLLITWVGFATGILGYQTDMVFPPTEVFSVGMGLTALTAGIAAIMIPFIALFHIMLRVLFKTSPMNSYFSLSLWAGWIVSIIAIIFFVIIGVGEFKESSTIKVEKPLERQEVYHFSEKDVRVIEASTAEEGKKIYNIEVEGEELSSYLRRDIHITFVSIDSLAAPYIEYHYFAKGKTRAIAAERASHIKYLAHQDKGLIQFDSHFALPNSVVYRDQSVSLVVHLPIGSKIVIDENLQHKIWDTPYYDCINEYAESEKLDETEWIMKKSGLMCAPSAGLEKKKENKESDATESE